MMVLNILFVACRTTRWFFRGTCFHMAVNLEAEQFSTAAGLVAAVRFNTSSAVLRSRWCLRSKSKFNICV